MLITNLFITESDNKIQLTYFASRCSKNWFESSPIMWSTIIEINSLYVPSLSLGGTAVDLCFVRENRDSRLAKK